MNDEIIVLIDENGKEVKFEIIANFEVNDQEYAVLSPVDSDDDSATIFKIVDDGDEPVLEYLTDDDEFEFVAKAYEELLEEE